MKKIILTLLILLSFSIAQDISIVKTNKLFDNNSEYLFPFYAEDSINIILTKTGYKGLWSYNRQSGEIITITKDPGAGYYPLTQKDGSIYYRSDEFKNRLKYSNIKSYQAGTKSTKSFSAPDRFVSHPTTDGQNIIYDANGKIKIFTPSGQILSKSLPKAPVLINSNAELNIIENGEMKKLEPKGEGRYIWASMSPDKNKILFTKSDDGTYISDISGKILTDLGDAHAATWSPDGKYILYMKDIDDGYRVTDSEIWIASLDGNHHWQLTDTPDKIELYPRWSLDGKDIIYHTETGNIYESELEIKE